MLQGDGDQQPLLTFIDDCMKQTEQKALIEVQSQIWIVQDELDEYILKFILHESVSSFFIKNKIWTYLKVIDDSKS